jgi:hypothetical protein
MGLLDDAIREHLELKRRRGADAGDISRQESDALGPVRRLPDGGVDLPDTFEIEQPPAPEPESGPEPSRAASTPWDDEPTAAHEAPSERTYHPPSARSYAPPPSEPAPARTYEPPPARSYEPPAAADPAPPAAPEPEGWMEDEPQPIAEAKPWLEEPAARSAPRVPPEPEPEPAPWAPPPAAAPPPTRSYEPPAVPPGPAPWADEPEPELELEAAPDPEPEPESEHGSLLGRLRIGRRSKDAPAKPVEPEELLPEPLLDDAPLSFEPPQSPHPPSDYETRFPSPSPSYTDAPRQPPPPPAADDPPADDVLEETPDFLEETPEHDRLWFEQRPPRDFDFDG